MYQKLLNISRNLGFIDFGVAKVTSLLEEKKLFEEYLSRGYNAKMDYLRNNLEKRINPSLLYEGAESVFVFLAPYSQQNSSSGVSSFAYGIDYHKIIKDKLFQFISEAGIEGRPFVDSAPVIERSWAVRAGLGFIGKNHFLISPEYGLRTLIGVIVSTFPFENIDSPDLRFKLSKMPVDCGSCGRCISACPTGALLNNGFLDANKCISYCTIEDKTIYEKAPVDYSGSIFGCEKCLDVCPWNSVSSVQGWKEFEVNKNKIDTLSKEQWLEMSEETFNSEFKGTSLTRSGIVKLKNNINFA